MDALTHNVESYLSPAYHPLCDGIALEGVRIAARALPGAVRNGRDLARAVRHDDGVDDGRGRVPEGPRRRAFLRACAVDGRRSPSRACERHHDRPRDALQPRRRRPERWRSSRASPAFPAGMPVARFARSRPSSAGSRRSRPRSAFRRSSPTIAALAPSRARTSARWSTWPKRTSATRRIRARARAEDFQALFEAAL